MRCLDNGREGLKHKRECDFRMQLDLETVCAENLDSRVLVVQPADHSARHDTSDLLNRSWNGGIHGQ